MKFDGQALRAAREAAGLSQEQLAVKAGTAAATISRLECDVRPPTLGTVAKLADALHVPMESLFTTEAVA